MMLKVLSLFPWKWSVFLFKVPDGLITYSSLNSTKYFDLLFENGSQELMNSVAYDSGVGVCNYKWTLN